MKTDAELLRKFLKEGAEDAFTELVKRHINVVYSAAYREAGGDVVAAQNVTRLVFIELARRVARLQGHPTLAGWLYTRVRHLSAGRPRRQKE